MVLADDPDRERRTHFEQFPVASVSEEADRVASLADTTIAGVSTWGDPDELDYDLPTANVFHEGGAERLLDAIDAAVEDDK